MLTSGIELGLSGLLAGAFAHWAISLIGLYFKNTLTRERNYFLKAVTVKVSLKTSKELYASFS